MLKNLTSPHVRGLIAEKLESGLAPATVPKIRSTLHKALSQAVSDGLIPRNAADVKAPRPTPKEMRPFSEEEARLFLEATRGDPFEALYVLALTTGLRRGELLGLRWDDVDLERGTLRVGRALVREGGRHAVGETKTRMGRRQVNLTPRTVKALRAHRKRQLEEKMRLVGLYEESGLIFTTHRATPVNPENLVRRSLKPLLGRAGLPDIRFHDLRHTCATLLLGRGVHPKLLQELLGHATIAMTLDTYSHYLPYMGIRPQARWETRWANPRRYCQHTRNAIRAQHLVPGWLGCLASDNRHSYDEPFREAKPRVSESQVVSGSLVVLIASLQYGCSKAPLYTFTVYLPPLTFYLQIYGKIVWTRRDSNS